MSNFKPQNLDKVKNGDTIYGRRLKNGVETIGNKEIVKQRPARNFGKQKGGKKGKI